MNEEFLKFCAELPFDVIADPEKRLYAQFGVRSEIRALFSPSVWAPLLRGVLRSLSQFLHRPTPLPSLTPDGGRFGLPADFLIASTGAVLACIIWLTCLRPMGRGRTSRPCSFGSKRTGSFGPSSEHALNHPDFRVSQKNISRASLA